MPPKARTPAPIDRPLSRAYLREFTGWSTAYPPGISDPTSLRVMENVMINRDGSVRVRPGLRYVSRIRDTGVSLALQPPLPASLEMVGTHETFYLFGGIKAYLFAVRDTVNNAVTFRVAFERFDDLTSTYRLYVHTLTDASIYGGPFDITGWPAYGPNFTLSTTYVKYVQIDNKILALSNSGEPFIVFHVGATKKVPVLSPYLTGSVVAPGVFMPRHDWVSGSQDTLPIPASTLYADTLQSSTAANNVYNYGFFYTFSSEIGETDPSPVQVLKLSQPFGTWRWLALLIPPANVADAPRPNTTGAIVADPKNACDQFILTFTGIAAKVAEGANRVNAYLFSWSDQDPVPVTAVLVATKDLPAGATDASHGWVALNPGSSGLGVNVPVPNVNNEYNSTVPSRAAQGIVAADRLVLVNDPVNGAVIKWTTNEQGNYLNFSPSRGGGFKTLTSGNLQIPACVKLWQNPQSADTLTVLCMGDDGHSTGYYMAPAQVASQSEATNIIGFEETTATPGTVSPFGCEVANNALYHPLDDQLMKSTASNYNINHKSMTDPIANRWMRLVNKKNIVSCYHDGRLYFLVHNPDGEPLPTRCMGNEVWVLDLTAKEGTWSRWLTPGSSLRKISLEGRVLLSLVKPDGLYVFDELYDRDEYISAGAVATRYIPWKLETNTQGANRAHDAWAHLQQVNLVLGNFQGTMRYGIRSWDINGKPVEIAKQTRDLDVVDPATVVQPYDVDDYLLVRRDLKEWFFFAESVESAGAPLHSYGQLNLVQYRYTPSTVNTGYEYGSIETFEYARAAVNWAERTTDNGVPQPVIDTRQP